MTNILRVVISCNNQRGGRPLGAPCGALPVVVARTLPGVLLGRPRPRASDRRAHYEMLQFSSHLQISAIITYAHICARYLLFIAR